MKARQKRMVVAAVMGLSVVASGALFASGSSDHGHEESHGHNDDHGHNEQEFEHTMTEFGMYDPAMKATRSIEIGMREMQFTPDVIKVKKGDVIKFVHNNTGQLMHEFVLGTPSSLNEHAELMKKFPTMEHSEPYMTHVKPGEQGSIMWQFSEEGTYAFGCLIPGHYDAGMKGSIVVES